MIPEALRPYLGGIDVIKPATTHTKEDS
jgi:hypothetical protein